MQHLYIHNQSVVHQADARVKLILSLAFVLFLSLTPQRAWAAYILFLTLSLSVALISRLGVGFVLRRALVAMPFVLAALPLIFRESVSLSTWSLTPAIRLTYSPPGLERFASIAIKTWISAQAAVLLAATTRFPDLLVGLRQLRIPSLFLAIIGLMWRYLFVISEEVMRMVRGRASRSAAAGGGRRAGGSLVWRAGVTGGMAGSLFLRSLERSERIYAAMLARGYNGEPVAIDTAPLSSRDRIGIALGVALLTFFSLLGVASGG